MSPNAILRWLQLGGQPILVIGHGRSGTSWIGATLGQSPPALYCHEPCNPDRWDDGRFAHWFSYAEPGDRSEYLERCLDRAFSGLTMPGARWPQQKKWRRLRPGYRIVVKEVAAVMAAGWVYERYRPAMVVVVRHPCAVALSEHKRNVDAAGAVRELLVQTRLVEKHLKPYREALKLAKNRWQRFGAIWGARNRVLMDQVAPHPEWTLLSYEELALDALAGYRSLFSTLRLPWSRGVEKYIARTTSTNKPGPYSTSRVSSQRVGRWRTTMTADQIQQVLEFAAKFELPFLDPGGRYHPDAALAIA